MCKNYGFREGQRDKRGCDLRPQPRGLIDIKLCVQATMTSEYFSSILEGKWREPEKIFLGARNTLTIAEKRRGSSTLVVSDDTITQTKRE